MKRFLIPALVFLAIFFSVTIMAINQSYQKTQYNKDMMAHMMRISEGGELIAEYDGQTINVLGRNIDRLRKVVTVSDKKWLYKSPKYDEDEAIVLTFPDGGKYIVAEDDSMDDAVFLLYTYKNRKLFFSIAGYSSFSWAQKAISAEGIYNSNEIID